MLGGLLLGTGLLGNRALNTGGSDSSVSTLSFLFGNWGGGRLAGLYLTFLSSISS